MSSVVIRKASVREYSLGERRMSRKAPIYGSIGWTASSAGTGKCSRRAAAFQSRFLLNLAILISLRELASNILCSAFAELNAQ